MDKDDEILAAIVASDPAPVEPEGRKVDLLERRYLARLTAEETEVIHDDRQKHARFESAIWSAGAHNVYIETADTDGFVEFSVEVDPKDGSDKSKAVIAAIDENMDELTGRKAEAEPLWGMF